LLAALASLEALADALLFSTAFQESALAAPSAPETLVMTPLRLVELLAAPAPAYAFWLAPAMLKRLREALLTLWTLPFLPLASLLEEAFLSATFWKDWAALPPLQDCMLLMVPWVPIEDEMAVWPFPIEDVWPATLNLSKEALLMDRKPLFEEEDSEPFSAALALRSLFLL